MGFQRWLTLAFQFGTILPVPATRAASERDLRISAGFFPLVGLILGGGLWSLQVVLSHILPLWPGAILALASYTVVTGALHLDGLMDLIDGIGSGKNATDALEVMRDSRVGALGAVSGILVLGGKLIAFGNLPPLVVGPGPYLFIPMLSRLCMVWAMAMAPSARGGRGLGGLYARHIPQPVLWSSTCGVLVVGLLVWPSLFVAIGMIGAALVTFAYAKWLTHRFGGMTGDMYGGLNEIIEWAGWLAATGGLTS